MKLTPSVWASGCELPETKTDRHLVYRVVGLGGQSAIRPCQIEGLEILGPLDSASYFWGKSLAGSDLLSLVVGTNRPLHRDILFFT